LDPTPLVGKKAQDLFLVEDQETLTDSFFELR
jgi:hypothetical protein